MPERPPGGSVRVLLVDDDPVFRDLAVEALHRRAGLSPTGASTPREALAELRNGEVHVVVSDHAMPGAEADGADLYRAVRDRWPALPFVFFTGTPYERLSRSVGVESDPAAGYVRRGPLPSRHVALGRRVERAVDREADPRSRPTLDARAVESFCR